MVLALGLAGCGDARSYTEAEVRRAFAAAGIEFSDSLSTVHSFSTFPWSLTDPPEIDAVLSKNNVYVFVYDQPTAYAHLRTDFPAELGPVRGRRNVIVVGGDARRVERALDALE